MLLCHGNSEHWTIQSSIIIWYKKDGSGQSAHLFNPLHIMPGVRT